jgi:hypothetical protein
MEKYKYKLLDGIGVIDTTEAATLDEALKNFNGKPKFKPKPIYEFPGMAVVETERHEKFGVTIFGVTWERI